MRVKRGERERTGSKDKGPEGPGHDVWERREKSEGRRLEAVRQGARAAP